MPKEETEDKDKETKTGEESTETTDDKGDKNKSTDKDKSADKDKSTEKKDDKDKEDPDKVAMAKRLEEFEKKETERLEAEANKKKDEEDAKKTQEQRDAERDLETKRLKQTLMVKDTREELGYTHKVFRHFDASISAEDPALAKKQLEKVKADLDEYVKSMGPVDTPDARSTKDKSGKDNVETPSSGNAAFEMFGVGGQSKVAV